MPVASQTSFFFTVAYIFEGSSDGFSASCTGTVGTLNMLLLQEVKSLPSPMSAAVCPFNEIWFKFYWLADRGKFKLSRLWCELPFVGAALRPI